LQLLDRVEDPLWSEIRREGESQPCEANLVEFRRLGDRQWLRLCVHGRTSLSDTRTVSKIRTLFCCTIEQKRRQGCALTLPRCSAGSQGRDPDNKPRDKVRMPKSKTSLKDAPDVLMPSVRCGNWAGGSARHMASTSSCVGSREGSMPTKPRTAAAITFMPASASPAPSPASRRMPVSSSTGRMAAGVTGP